MFINIVRTPQDGESRRHTSLYECDRYHLRPVKGQKTQFIITMEGKYGEVQAIYDTTDPQLGVFVMNDRGRTIDTIFRSER